MRHLGLGDLAVFVRVVFDEGLLPRRQIDLPARLVFGPTPAVDVEHVVRNRRNGLHLASQPADVPQPFTVFDRIGGKLERFGYHNLLRTPLGFPGYRRRVT